MKKTFFSYILSLVLLGTLLFFSACYPNQNSSPEDWDISVTFKNPNFDFGNIVSYALVDSVAHGDAKTPDKTFDKTILDAVENNLGKLGWTSAPIEEADVVIFCSAANTNVYSYWVDYWYPYWDIYYPGYYIYYPWSYGGVTYDYTEGTVCIQMNYTEADDTGKVPVLWVGIIDGVLNDSNKDIKARIQSGVNQCFEDSLL